jgi:hypothetical protein
LLHFGEVEGEKEKDEMMAGGSNNKNSSSLCVRTRTFGSNSSSINKRQDFFSLSLSGVVLYRVVCAAQLIKRSQIIS